LNREDPVTECDGVFAFCKILNRIHNNDVNLPMGLQITVVSTAGTPEGTQTLLQELGFIFK